LAAREAHYQKCPKQSGDGYTFAWFPKLRIVLIFLLCSNDQQRSPGLPKIRGYSKELGIFAALVSRSVIASCHAKNSDSTPFDSIKII